VRIALVHKRLDLKGGTERDLYRTAEGLRDLGHEVHLFCSEYGVPTPKDTMGHRIPVLPFGRTARLWSGALFPSKIIQKYKCDVVVSFGRMIGADIVRCGGGTHKGFLERLAREGGVLRALWQKSSVYHRSLLNIERRQFEHQETRRIIAVSGEVKRDIIRHYSVPEEKITVLYNGVDAELFHPARRAQFRDSMRARWRVPVNAPLVLFVGSGFYRKRLERLIALWSRPKLSKIYLLVVGDDARMNWYKSRARNVAGSRIIFTGRQSDIEKYYAAADLVVLPSIQEAFGNVVLEALASGVPALVSRNAGAAELLKGDFTEAVLEYPDDLTEMESKMLDFLDRSRDPACRERARRLGQEYSWQKHFQSLEALLIAIGQSRSRSSVA